MCYHISEFQAMIGHNGIDIVAPHGTPMEAVEDGRVVQVKSSPDGHGKHVRIVSRRADSDGFNHLWVYGHCDTILVEVGDRVRQGDVIATMGNTGFVVSGHTPYWKYNPHAGTHLHLGLRLVKFANDGWSYEGSDLRLKVNDYNNGYKGGVDPYPYLSFFSKEEKVHRGLQLTLIGLLNTIKKLYV